MKYFYTEIVVNPDSNVKEPAKMEGGSLVSAMEDLVGGITTLKFDESIPSNGRYVFACPDDQSAQQGWDEKSADEVNVDYPGLVGG